MGDRADPGARGVMGGHGEPNDENALWSEIYANPEDLTPRFVLADAYTERGDPRGPFMSASLNALSTGARPRGEAALLTRHEAAWLGDFNRYTTAPRVWRGGVLTGAVTSGLSLASRARAEWRVVQELRFETSLGMEELTSSAFPSLRVLGLVPVRMLPWLESSELLVQLETVYVGMNLSPTLNQELRILGAFSAPEKLILVGVHAEAAARDSYSARGRGSRLFNVSRYRLAEASWLPSRPGSPRAALWPPIVNR